jgi:2-isopropylmalate synthase
VGIFLGVNDVTRRARVVGRETGELFAMIRSSVSRAAGLGLKVRYTVEDASRTHSALLLEAFQTALEAGADRLGFADTVGALEPRETAEIVAQLRSAFPGVPLEVHFHDDRGLALANALAAVDAGADWISAAVNGLGERCGVTDLAALLANLHARGDRLLTQGRELRDLSRRVAAYSRSPQDMRRPVVGAHAFQHASRLHRLAFRRDVGAYCTIEPELVASRGEEVSASLPADPQAWIVRPAVISAAELRHHRPGPGERYVLIDDRFVPHARQYCIARRIPQLDDYGPGHIDVHTHHCDSLFVFLGSDDDYAGLNVEVMLEGRRFPLASPASVFIPAGVAHSYRVVAGSGTFINHVLAGDYNSSLLEPAP